MKIENFTGLKMLIYFFTKTKNAGGKLYRTKKCDF